MLPSYVTGCLMVLLTLYIFYIVLLHLMMWPLLIVLCIWSFHFAVKQTQKISPENRTVIITGCDSGFGNALARKLDYSGFKVIACCLYESGEGAKQLQSETNVFTCNLDVTSVTSVLSCLEYVKQNCREEDIWALINNAGILSMGDAESTTMEEYKSICEVNLFGLIRMTKTFLPLIKKSKGRIVNISSVRGLAAVPGRSAYAISKFGVEAFSDSLRLEVTRFGVKVIVIEPGCYGNSTSIMNRAGFQIMKEQTNSEVQIAHKEKLLTDMLKTSTKLNPKQSMDPVINVIEEAVTLVYPSPRTLVYGNSTMIDIECMLARLRTYLPTSLSDFFINCFYNNASKKKTNKLNEI